MTTYKFTKEEKLKAVQREIAFRQNVYPKRTAAGLLKQDEADRQIALMLAIAADYMASIARDNDRVS